MKTATLRSFACVSFLSLMILQSAQAQDYVLNFRGDTLRGALKVINYGADRKVIVTGADKKKVSTPIFQIKEYAVKGEKYVPAKGPAGYTFMKVLKSGYLSLLAFQLENQTSFDGRFLLKKDGQGVEVPNLTFKKTLKNFLRDCDHVANKIENGEFSRNEIEIIIDQYNECITGKQVEVEKQIAVRKDQAIKLNPWEALETKIKNTADLQSKDDAIEMIKEIKAKISRSEKVPNFMIEGLKSTLTHPDLQAELEAALKEIK